MTDTGWQMSGELSPADAEKLERVLSDLSDAMGIFPPTFSYFEQKNSALWRVDIFFTEKPEPSFTTALLKKADLDHWSYRILAIEDKDWVSESQRLLSPVKAGRFFVFGSHDKELAHETFINLQVDAGQAFGTGKHETTSACLELLDAIADKMSPRNYLDLGTGSGVLALAAAKVWPSVPGTASDIDPIAVKVAEENCRINDIVHRPFGSSVPGLAVKTADGLQDSDLREEQPYDLIFANILAGPLIEMCSDITTALSPTGTLILSGLLTEQKKEVYAAYAALGLSLADTVESGDWTALRLQFKTK